FVVASPFSFFSIRYLGGDGGHCKQVAHLKILEDSPVNFSLLFSVKSMVVDTWEEAMVVVLATTAMGWVTWPRKRRQFIFSSAANCFFYDLIETNILSSCIQKTHGQLHFDCNMRNPTWAWVMYRVFICNVCSAVRRIFEVHISFLRKVSLLIV
ncbi:hypothetical protein S83_013303, partial [Arachis hypogaea]